VAASATAGALLMDAGDAGSWEAAYRRDGMLWGERPSELAKLAVEVLAAGGVRGPTVTVLDLGCGYGRDARFLWRELGVSVVGVDPSPEAVTLARELTPAAAPVEFRCAGFRDLGDLRVEVALCTNLLHLLGAADRGRLAEALTGTLLPGGRLFLMTLSPSDPQHYGRGEPVPGDPGSFVDHRLLHFAGEDELRRAFAGLRIEQLAEHAYQEPCAHGATHDHVSWRLVAVADQRT
jgi:SAM-dependent methyltransferase